MPNNNNNNNTRGRFLLGRAAPSLRRPQRKSKNTYFRKNQNRPQLSPLKETAEPLMHKTPRQPQFSYSKSPIIAKETIDATGFSRAELHDLEESFKLFDVYGEGSIQVGDLKGILEMLQQEQQGEDNKYPHLETLLSRLDEVADEDTLDLEDYVRLMASTTIGNSLAMESNGNASQEEHFSRVFELFDTQRKGYITLQDLEQIAIELGEHDMTRGELQEMIDRAVGTSTNNEKKVDMEAFTRMMTMNLFSSQNEQ